MSNCRKNCRCNKKHCFSCVPPVYPSCSPPVYIPIPDVTNTIFNQWSYNEMNATKFLKVVKKYEICLNKLYPDTETYPGQAVYGYSKDGQQLILGGGMEKSYNKAFKKFLLKYHGTDESEMLSNGPEQVKRNFDKIISFYAQRGFTLMDGDLSSAYKGFFISSWSAGTISAGGLRHVATRFVFNKRGEPISLDLVASADFAGMLEPYEPDSSNYRNTHTYPIRIPITTDYCGVFLPKQGVEPIVFYDCSTQNIIIHVPPKQGNYYLGFVLLNFPELNPPIFVHRNHYLVSFDGTFSLLRRNSHNQLVPSTPKCTDILAQVSETITIRSSRTVNPDSPNPIIVPASNVIPMFEEDQYTGLTCPLMNGGDNYFDSYNIPVDGGFAYVVTENPFELLHNEDPQGKDFPDGDNQGSRIVEKYSSGSSVTAQVDPPNPQFSWNLFVVGLDRNVILGQTFPENLATTPSIYTTSYVRLWDHLFGHEMLHSSQRSSGIVSLVPAEAMATSLANDPKISETISLDGARHPDAMMRIYDGIMGPMSSPGTSDSPLNTYGLAVFWTYIQRLFDFNFQVQRRVADILGAETWGPLAEANGIPYSSAITVRNQTGALLALDQALQELQGLSLKQVWTDFSIAVALLRNNTSIPEKYRSLFPYWIYDSAYAGFADLSARLIANDSPVSPFIPTMAQWWEIFDSNQVVPANWTYGASFGFQPFIHRGQEFITILPATVTKSLEAFKALVYAVPNDRTNVTATSVAGEWAVSLVQFTSDGTEAGTFVQSGPFTLNPGDVHVFNVAALGFTPNGIIKLVCSQLSTIILGGLNDYYSFEPVPGTINITSV